MTILTPKTKELAWDSYQLLNVSIPKRGLSRSPASPPVPLGAPALGDFIAGHLRSAPGDPRLRSQHVRAVPGDPVPDGPPKPKSRLEAERRRPRSRLLTASRGWKVPRRSQGALLERGRDPGHFLVLAGPKRRCSLPGRRCREGQLYGVLGACGPCVLTTSRRPISSCFREPAPEPLSRRSPAPLLTWPEAEPSGLRRPAARVLPGAGLRAPGSQGQESSQRPPFLFTPWHLDPGMDPFFFSPGPSPGKKNSSYPECVLLV
ncbi:uncharacterized protein LOC101705321 [Heterocephalus glaber]|uniref:Uncharacterized protein LOC101705321 n=1 Tax=Heterocephalus glaber TaxID=10181 RepID=A0AAX6SJE4_HETGA|nr:uncharacterized protein LOC101705321 [Heterocephalus glaber]